MAIMDSHLLQPSYLYFSTEYTLSVNPHISCVYQNIYYDLLAVSSLPVFHLFSKAATKSLPVPTSISLYCIVVDHIFNIQTPSRYQNVLLSSLISDKATLFWISNTYLQVRLQKTYAPVSTVPWKDARM